MCSSFVVMSPVPTKEFSHFFFLSFFKGLQSGFVFCIDIFDLNLVGKQKNKIGRCRIHKNLWSAYYFLWKHWYETAMDPRTTDARRGNHLHWTAQNPPPPIFLGASKPYFVCHIGPNFQISLWMDPSELISPQYALLWKCQR